jgi:hypothetical protein
MKIRTSMLGVAAVAAATFGISQAANATVNSTTGAAASGGEEVISMQGGGCKTFTGVNRFGNFTECTQYDNNQIPYPPVWSHVHWNSRQQGCNFLQLRLVYRYFNPVTKATDTDPRAISTRLCNTAADVIFETPHQNASYEFEGDYFAQFRTVDVNGHAGAWWSGPVAQTVAEMHREGGGAEHMTSVQPQATMQGPAQCSTWQRLPYGIARTCIFKYGPDLSRFAVFTDWKHNLRFSGCAFVLNRLVQVQESDVRVTAPSKFTCASGRKYLGYSLGRVARSNTWGATWIRNTGHIDSRVSVLSPDFWTP